MPTAVDSRSSLGLVQQFGDAGAIKVLGVLNQSYSFGCESAGVRSFVKQCFDGLEIAAPNRIEEIGGRLLRLSGIRRAFSLCFASFVLSASGSATVPDCTEFCK